MLQVRRFEESLCIEQKMSVEEVVGFVEALLLKDTPNPKGSWQEMM